MTTLAEFLLARIAEDEAEVEQARRLQDYMPPGAWDLDRVLAECAAKRRIVEMHSPFHITTKNDGLNWDYRGCTECNEPDDWSETDGDWYPCRTLRFLAAPFADHPDYDPSWTLGPSAQENG